MVNGWSCKKKRLMPTNRCLLKNGFGSTGKHIDPDFEVVQVSCTKWSASPCCPGSLGSQFHLLDDSVGVEPDGFKVWSNPWLARSQTNWKSMVLDQESLQQTELQLVFRT